MAKLPDVNSLGPLPETRVPYGTPNTRLIREAAQMAHRAGEGISQLGEGLIRGGQELNARQARLDAASATAALQTGMLKLWQNPDTTHPGDFDTVAQTAASGIRDQQTRDMFLATHAATVYQNASKFHTTQILSQHDEQILQQQQNAIADPYNQTKYLKTIQSIVDSEQGLGLSRTQLLQRSRQAVTNTAVGIAQHKALTDPEGFLRDYGEWQKGLPAPPAPNPNGIDRSQFRSELEQNPALVQRMADMVKGEVGFNDPKKATIQLETAFNRAQARGIPLDQALLSVADNAKKGYYASDTYSKPASPDEVASFQQNILNPVLSGSDEGTRTFGFTPTGNASEGNNKFASSRAAQGLYANSSWYSGVPGHGEMYATEKADADAVGQLPRLSGAAGTQYASLDTGIATDASGAASQPSVMYAANYRTDSPFSYIPPAALQKLADHALYNKAVLTQKSDTQESKMMLDIANGKIPSPDDVYNNPDMQMSAKNRVWNAALNPQKQETPASIALMKDLATRIDLPPGDPNRVTNKNPINEAFDKGPLTISQHNALTTKLTNLTTETGQKVESNIKSLLGLAKGVIDPIGLGMLNGTTPRGLYNYEQDLRKAVSDYSNDPQAATQKYGAPTVDGLFDKDSPAFFGSDKVLKNPQYKPSLQQQTSSAAGSAPARLPGESMSTWFSRTHQAIPAAAPTVPMSE